MEDVSDLYEVLIDDEIWQDVPRERLLPKSRGTLGGIFLTNAVSGQDDETHLYLESARLNHSCFPNAQVVTIGQERHIFVTRAIQEGEEISITYTEDFSTSEACPGLRQQVHTVSDVLGVGGESLLVGLFRQQLFAKWGFWCLCERCAPVVSDAEEALAKWLTFV